MSIEILAQDVRDQIAAGEVVERPASVVKELVENAIDARATQIDIDITKGGKDAIIVTDNGVGMSPEDARKAPLRHATSKIRTIDDLFTIQSYGFRGEALAAIASVSQFDLITKDKASSSATHINLHGGKDMTLSTAPANTGTRIEVRELFCTTPVRRSHLKTDETEYREIFKIIAAFALMRPEISFRLLHNENTKLDLPATQKLSDRYTHITRQKPETLLSLHHREGAYAVTGIIGTPASAIKSRSQQYIFVNGRPIEDRLISYSIREAYRQYVGLENGFYPHFCIRIQTADPLLVDINVHPRKTEVKFTDPNDVFSVIRHAITQTLAQISGVETPSSSGNTFTAPPHRSKTPSQGLLRSNAQFQRFVQQDAPKLNFHDRNWERDLSTPTQTHTPPSQNENTPPTGLRPIGQIARKYIIAESEDGIFVFDQHALHERIRFEKLLIESQNKSITRQNLLIPQQITLTTDELSLLKEHDDELQNLGFELSIDADHITLSTIPTLLAQENLEALFQDFVRYFTENAQGEHGLQAMLRTLLNYRACRGAIKFGDILTPSEMERLMEDFQKTPWRLSCPHGRPNHVFWSFEAIDREFHRN